MCDLRSATRAETRAFAAASSALFVVGLLAVTLMLVALFVFLISLFVFVPLFWNGIAPHTIPLAVLLGFGSAFLAVVCELLAIGLGIAGRKHLRGSRHDRRDYRARVPNADFAGNSRQSLNS
jgi:hypothetical protein